MKVYAKLFYSLFILFLIILSGCTKNPTVTDLWLDEAYDGRQYGNILVIGIAEKITFRSLFEGELVRQIKQQGAEAIPSYILLPDNEKLTREIVLSAIEKYNIDSVLITSLAGKSKKTVTYGQGNINPYTYFNSFYSSMNDPAGKTSYDIDVLFLKTNLYDIKSEKLIWSMTLESEVRYDTKSLSPAVKLVIDKLRDDGLI